MKRGLRQFGCGNQIPIGAGEERDAFNGVEIHAGTAVVLSE
jgi:hypothetical protein